MKAIRDSLSSWKDVIGTEVIYLQGKKFKSGKLQAAEIELNEQGMEMQFLVEGSHKRVGAVYRSKAEAIQDNVLVIMHDNRLFDKDVTVPDFPEHGAELPVTDFYLDPKKYSTVPEAAFPQKGNIPLGLDAVDKTDGQWAAEEVPQAEEFEDENAEDKTTDNAVDDTEEGDDELPFGDLDEDIT